MKSLKIIISLILVFALIVSCFAAPAEAAIMTAAMLGAGLIAVAAGAGAIYGSVSQSQLSLQEWASNRVDSWLDGRTIAEAFGAEYIRMMHGKLIIPAVIYNAFQDMIDTDIESTGVQPGETAVIVSTGIFGNRIVNVAEDWWVKGYATSSEAAIKYDFGDILSDGFSASYNRSTGAITTYWDGVVSETFTPSWGNATIRNSVTDYALICSSLSETSVVMVVGCNWNGFKYVTVKVMEYPAQDSDATIRLDSAWEKDVCDVGYQWEGNISGSEADTNIDDLIDTIYKEAIADTLGVTGEIESESPYPPQPTEYPIDDVLGGMDTINQSINDAGKDVTDAIGSVVDGIHSQTGAINDAASAVSDKVQSLEDTLVESLDVPTTSEASGFKWDLSQLFPFCIPFDIAAMYQAFDGVAAAPNIQIPIVIPSIGFSYTMQLDFSPFNSVAAILRQVELIAFGLALAWGTSKVIRW